MVCPAPRVSAGPSPAHLVELVLQETLVQTQVSKASLLHRLDDPVHLGVVRHGHLGEVDVLGDEVVTEDVGVEVSQDLLRVPEERR